MANWIGTGTGSWSVGTNWSTGAPPIAGSDVTITTGNVTVSAGSNFFNSLSLSGGRSLDISGGLLSMTTATIGTNAADVVVLRTGGRLTVANQLNVGGTVNGAAGGGTFIIGGATAAEASGIFGTLLSTIALNSVGSKLVFNTTDDFSFNFGATGSGGIDKRGSSTVSLNANAVTTYAGVTNVFAGTLRVLWNNSLGATTNGTVVASGASLLLDGSLTIGAEGLTLAGTGVSNSGALRATGGMITYGGAISLNGAASIVSNSGATLLLTNAISTTTGSPITFGGSGNTEAFGVISVASLVKEGTGTLVLRGANTYTGSTQINAGVIRVTNASGLGTAAGGVSVSNNAALRLEGVNIGTEALTLAGTGFGGVGGALESIAGASVVGGQVQLSATTRIEAGGGTLLLSGTIVGSNLGLIVGGGNTTTISAVLNTSLSALIKDGTGTLNLSGLNTITADTTITSGTLALTGNGTLENSRLLLASNANFSIANNNAAFVSVLRFDNSPGAGNIILGGKILSIADQGIFSLGGNFVGSAGVDQVYINTSSSVLNASALTFSTWTNGVDVIRLNGTSFANTITGTAQADTITGFAGNDTLNGGFGFDSAAVSGNLSSIAIIRAADGRYRITSNDGVDSALNIERVVGSNGSILLGGAELTDRRFGDYDGDGRADIAFRGTNGEIAIWRMNAGNFSSISFLQTMPNSWRMLGEGDFDGDGRDDILWRNNDGQLVTWFMQNASSFSAASGTLTVGAGNEWMVQDIGDYNGDGKDDILWRRDDGLVGDWLMNGLAPTAFGTPGSVGFNWKVQGSGDTDGDGKDDIIWREETTGQVLVWKMNGTTFSGAGTGNVGSVGLDWDIAAIADISGDGKADIIWRNNTTGAVHGWIMNGQSITSAGYIGGADLGWHIQGAGDFNGDGRADLMWARNDGSTATWRLNGLSLVSGESSPNVGTGWLAS
jgi:autotransporter-associated beta strand protein